MKKKDYIIYASYFGLTGLFYVIALSIIEKKDYLLFLKLFGKIFIYLVIYTGIPVTLFNDIIKIYFNNSILFQNISNIIIFIWIYIAGVIAMKNLLNWKRETVDNGFNLLK